MPDQDLSDCLSRVRQGDSVASRELVERLYPQVLRIVRSHLPRRESEEDLAQEVFLKLFTRLHQYEERAGVPFEHWVSKLAVRTCLDALRSERRHPEVRLTDLQPADSSSSESQWLDYLLSNSLGNSNTPPPQDEGSAMDAAEAVRTLLAQLPASDRLVLSLLDLEQKSVREIAQITGWSMPLVKVRAFRARMKLRKTAANLAKELGYEDFR